MAAPNILVIDSDEGFGNMLKEGLQNSGHYRAKCVHTGSNALEAVIEEPFDLVIIDMDLADMSPLTLVQAIREAKSGMRIMMIPLMGQDLPDQVKSLDINGVLTKPFFVGDLPDLINQALGRRPPPPPIFPGAPGSPATQTPPPPTKAPQTAGEKEDPPPAIADEEGSMPAIAAVPQETIRFLRANESEILRLLDDLNVEVRAEAILLIAGRELIAQAGMLDRDHCEELTLLVAQSSQAAAQAARFLGEQGGSFIQSLHEGEAYRLYTLTLGERILLSLALSSNVPLGMIRHQCRQVAEQLSRFII
ncbi:MAG: response regulator [Anaerolineae bacterium]|nr:response regulator [Anaerolineae bacterium]